MKILKIAVLFLAFIGIYQGLKSFCHKRTDGFTILGISSNRPYDKQWESAYLLTQDEKRELDSALSQKFHYLACGGQSFVFLSEDEQYVIKFFKQRVFNFPKWLTYFPVPFVLDRYKKKKLWHRQDKFKRDFTSYKIAIEKLREETEVLFIHLNHTSNLGKQLKIIDKIGIQHEMNLDHFDFIVQRKAELVTSKISLLMKEGKLDEAKQIINLALHLIVTRCKKGFHDRDSNLLTNCGFIENKAIKIDVGRLLEDSNMQHPEFYKKEIVRIALPFKLWLDEHYSLLSPFFEEKVSQILLESYTH